MTRPTVDATYMAVAALFAQRSRAKRRQVGAVIVRDGILAEGYNGTPPGWPNECEGEDGKTLPYVIHAEANALDKCVRKGISPVGAAVYVTTAPCMECAKRLWGAGILQVVYRDVYRSTDGIDFLKKVGISVKKEDPTI